MTIEKKLIKPKESINELLDEQYKVRDSIYNGRWTKSALFLLQMVGINLNKDKLALKYLYNVFIDDKDFDHEFTRPLFLLLRTKSFVETDFRKFMNFLDFRLYDYDLGIQDGYKLVMIVCSIPNKYKDDYYHFRAGRYSKMSAAYKEKFSKYTIDSAGEKVESIVWGALHKSPSLKDRVAKMFCVKDEKGEVKNPQDLIEMREYIDTLDEIWEAPRQDTEVYRYKKD